jgi:malate permease and related proteins
MQIQIIFTQILILAILVMIGIVASKAGVITLVTKDFLAGIIFNITLPLMLLCNFSKINITPNILSNSFIIIVLTLFVLLFMLLFGWLTSRVFKMNKREASIFKAHSVFGNIIYLGFPLIQALYGGEGLLYASMFQLVSNMFMWTVGVIILNQGKEFTLWQNVKHVLNPNTYAILLGFTMFLFSIKLPPFLMKSLSGLGDSNTYLSMLYIGSMMFYTTLKGFLNNKEVYILTINKLILVPFILLLLFAGLNFFFPGKIDILVLSVLLMQASMPAMVNIVIMAKIFGADDQLGTANVFVSTIISLVTLPLLLLMIEIIF